MIALLAAAAGASAAPGRAVRVGLLYAISLTFDPVTNRFDRELVEGLRDLGYVQGKDVIFEFRTGAGNLPRLQQGAQELVAAKVDVIVTPGTQATFEASKLTKTIPIVMVGTADVVETGLVASLARPGGNVTGLAINASELAAKRVQLLQEAVPKLARVAVLWNGSIQSMSLGFKNIEHAAPKLGVGTDLPRIVEFVAQHRIPTVFELGQGVRGGGLMEFGTPVARMARRAAVYIDKIANGARPQDLPVEEPTVFELVLNLKAAKSMGLTIPSTLLFRADRVVE